MSINGDEQVFSPFGGTARRLREVGIADVVAMYKAKCDVEVQHLLEGRASISQYECVATGMKFWRPMSLAGDEPFYAALGQRWPHYYKTDRWEYSKALSSVAAAGGNVLEVGCGRGYFLKRVEETGLRGVGLELNRDAIERKVTRCKVWNETIEAFRKRSDEKFAVVCSFQVLEHVTDPAGFIRDCASLVKPGGRLIFSTPNHDFEAHRSDPFDMPPHHMNHFTADAFRRIGELTGWKVESIDVQAWKQPRFAVYSNPLGSNLNRSLRRAVNDVMRVVAGTRSLPGENLLCVYQT